MIPSSICAAETIKMSLRTSRAMNRQRLCLLGISGDDTIAEFS